MQRKVWLEYSIFIGSSLFLSGADPELLLGGGANPYGGRLPIILVVFSEKPYEIKEILVRRRGACAGGAPPKSATVFTLQGLHPQSIAIASNSIIRVFPNRAEL